MATPPTPGTIGAGELLVDRQSRTLWLGVDVSIDPAQALLVSDILALMQADEDNLLEAKAYADTQVATRALSVHTHTSGQITDFTPAVQTVMSGAQSLFQKGMVMLYSGSLADIGVDNSGSGGPNLLDWRLCDGTTYGGFTTPNLTNAMIWSTSPSSVAVGYRHTAVTLLSALAGAHAHGGQTLATALSVANLPSHKHGTTDGTFDSFIGRTASGTYGVNSQPGGPFGLVADTYIGSNTGHGHGINSDAGHVHSLPSPLNGVNWVALAIIIKIN